jgi:hypothetical protein
MRWACLTDTEKFLCILQCLLEEFGLNRVCLLLPVQWQHEDWSALASLKTSFEREDDVIIMVLDDTGSTILERCFRLAC